MENWDFLLFLLIRLWMSFGILSTGGKGLGKQEPAYIQSEAGTLSYMWGVWGFVHSIHTPYYYY